MKINIIFVFHSSPLTVPHIVMLEILLHYPHLTMLEFSAGTVCETKIFLWLILKGRERLLSCLIYDQVWRCQNPHTSSLHPSAGERRYGYCQADLTNCDPHRTVMTGPLRWVQS